MYTVLKQYWTYTDPQLEERGYCVEPISNIYELPTRRTSIPFKGSAHAWLNELNTCWVCGRTLNVTRTTRRLLLYSPFSEDRRNTLVVVWAHCCYHDEPLPWDMIKERYLIDCSIYSGNPPKQINIIINLSILRYSHHSVKIHFF